MVYHETDETFYNGVYRSNSGKFRDIKWKILKQDRLDEKPGSVWLKFESVMEQAPGTQGNDFMIKQAKR